MNPAIRDTVPNACPRSATRDIVYATAVPDPVEASYNNCLEYGVPYSIAGLVFGICIAVIITLSAMMYRDRRRQQVQQNQEWGS